MLIAAKTLRQYPWFVRIFFWKQRRTYGRILDPGLLWGRSPAVFAGDSNYVTGPPAPAAKVNASV